MTVILMAVITYFLQFVLPLVYGVAFAGVGLYIINNK